MIRSLARGGGVPVVERVELLGAAGALRFAQREDGLHISLPAAAPGRYAVVYRLGFGR